MATVAARLLIQHTPTTAAEFRSESKPKVKPQANLHHSDPARKPNAPGTHSTDTAHSSKRFARHPPPWGPTITRNCWSATDTQERG